MIDGIDTATLELSMLRSHISVIPQDPTLFSGSLRYNLDPFDEYTDEQLWDALNKVQLKATASTLAGGLDFVVSETGGKHVGIAVGATFGWLKVMVDNLVFFVDTTKIEYLNGITVS